RLGRGPRRVACRLIYGDGLTFEPPLVCRSRRPRGVTSARGLRTYARDKFSRNSPFARRIANWRGIAEIRAPRKPAGAQIGVGRYLCARLVWSDCKKPERRCVDQARVPRIADSALNATVAAVHAAATLFSFAASFIASKVASISFICFCTSSV